ncbi:MAG: hypothetical protein M3Q79_01310 [bacterium]|nr:hypothetical protein [bacterium]
MNKNTKLAVFKTLFTLLGLSAVVTEIATLIERNIFAPSNFFSFLQSKAIFLPLQCSLLGLSP